MKQNVDPRVFIAVIAVIVIIIGVFAYRKFSNNPASGSAISPQAAGLGQPVAPSGSSTNPAAGANQGSAAQGNGPQGNR